MSFSNTASLENRRWYAGQHARVNLTLDLEYSLKLNIKKEPHEVIMRILVVIKYKGGWIGTVELFDVCDLKRSTLRIKILFTPTQISTAFLHRQ